LHAKLCSGLKLSDFSGFALNNVSRELSWCRTDSEIFSGLELRNQSSIWLLDLLIGVSLRSSNASPGHYYGDISRIGRALSESGELNTLRERLLTMIRDEKLDLFNRLLIAYLYSNHHYYLIDEEQKRNSQKSLREALATMPLFVARAFKE
jgi:hypothetical protein